MDKMELPLIQDGEDKTSPLCNKIRKNYRHVRKWAKRTDTNAFRIYDKDIKEYPLTIDFYDNRFLLYYFSDREDLEVPSDLKTEAEQALRAIFGAGNASIFWKWRIQRTKTEQYERLDQAQDFFEVMEYGVKFKVNLIDYLDTGLFLDHRETRQMAAKSAKDKSLLNLFAYTCSFSVHAAAAGASYTKSVDLSNTYLNWGKDNFLINGLPLKNNDFVRADCLKFLEEEKRRYDVIVLDPPTLSRSKKMDQMLDVQLDYPFLVSQSLKLLNPGGVLFFSTNLRKFQFDPSLFPEAKIFDITKKTIPIDFHNQKIHHCWKLELT